MMSRIWRWIAVTILLLVAFGGMGVPIVFAIAWLTRRKNNGKA